VEHDENTKPVDLSGVRLKNRFSLMNRKREMMEMVVELTQDGTEKFQPVQWPDLSLEKREDGSGLITGRIAKDDLPFFADYFLKYGEHALVKKPLALKKLLKERLAKALEQYRPL
jgi:predicted DNA-binding transcriptional regulator YafY